MLLKVYDQYKNIIGYTREYTDLEIESDLQTGDKTLSFTYQAKNLKLGDGEIQNEGYIETPDDLYVIKEIGISSDGYPEIVCQLDLEELEAEMVESFSAENMPIQDVANLALVGTGWLADTEGIDPEKLRSVATLKATPYTLLGKIRDAWMCEMQFDTKNQVVYFRDEFGEDRGVFFTETLNLRKLKLTDDSYDYYTRIVPIGEDDLRINDVNDGKGYVENYQYSSKVKTLIWEDTSYTDPEALKEDAEAKLDDMSKPSRSYSADVVDLAKQSEKYSVMDFELGDTITLLDQDSGIKDKQRIVKLKEYPDDPYKNSCELSNTTWTWEELQSKLQAAADAFEDISNADGTVNGYYVHGITSDGVLVVEKVTNPDGSTSTEVVGSLTDNLVTINDTVQNTYDTVINVAGDIVTISGELDVVYERVGTLEATSITATEADLKYATIETADILTEYVENLYGLYVSIESLVVDELAADVANIMSLLAGEAGVGELETIHLTTANAIIDEAVIAEALIGTVLADIINSNIIYTDIITIMSENGGIVISGTTMQISDENGVVRMQLGQDADGGFTFVIYDETGTGIMIDSEGIHASAVPDGLIVDSMVADDANIAASKIDIDDLTRTLNENGDLILTAEQITIGGGTLSYVLTQMQTEIDDLDAMGIESIENWYAIGTADAYPPFEWEEDESAVLGEGILGLMILGSNGTTSWTTDQPKVGENEYLWWCQKITYYDGTVVWTEPALWTDDYLRTVMSVTQTSLTVIQGQIQEKVWMSDIKESEDGLTTMITDQYGELTVLLDTIDARVGEMTTILDETENNVEILVSQVSSLTIDIGSITGRVSEVEEMASNALVDGVPYYAVSTSPDWYPPFDWEDDDSAVLGEGILGLMVLGVNGDSNWTTTQPTPADDEYVWIAYLRTRADGSTYWTDPTLLTDVYMRERYSELVMTIDSISLTVSGGALGGIASIVMSVGGESTAADIDLTQVREAFAAEDSEIDIMAGLIRFYSNTLVIYSDQLTLDDDGNLAINTNQFVLTDTDAIFSGTLNAPSGNIGGFFISDSSIYTSSDSFASVSGNIYIGSQGISLGTTFSVTSAGKITASNGIIGGFTVSSTKIYAGLDDNYDRTIVMQIPSDSITWVFAAGGKSHSSYSDCPFRVSKDGALYAEDIHASGGEIGGFRINSIRFYGDWESSDGVTYRTSIAAPADDLTFVIAAGGDTSTNAQYGYSKYPFRVSKTGQLYAENANITGSVTATSLTVYDAIYVYNSQRDTTASITTYYDSEGYGLTLGSGSISKIKIDGSLIVDGYTSMTGVLFAENDIYASENIELSGVLNITTSNSRGIYYTYTASSGSAGFYIAQKWSENIISMQIGSGGYNRGLYDNAASDGWIIYMDEGNSVRIGNKACDVYIGGSSSYAYLHCTEDSFRPTSNSKSNIDLGDSSYLWKRVYATNSSISTSDAREKTAIADIDSRYEDLFMLLKPVNYMWRNIRPKDHHDRVHCGLIAQDVEEACEQVGLSSMTFATLCWDELVEPTYDGRADRYSLAYGELHGLEIHMIQKTINRMDDAESRLDNLQSEVDRLTEENATLKQQLAEIKAA